MNSSEITNTRNHGTIIFLLLAVPGDWHTTFAFTNELLLFCSVLGPRRHTHTEVPQLVLHTKPDGEAENPRLPSPQPPLPPHPGEHRVIPKWSENYNLISESWSVLGSPSGKTCPKHLNQRRLWGILVRRPDHLNCLLSMWRRGGFTQRPFQMIELLTPESTAPFEGNLYL